MADADKAAEKQRRLAEALRENLKRRKTAARKVAGDRGRISQEPGEADATEPVADGGKR